VQLEPQALSDILDLRDQPEILAHKELLVQLEQRALEEQLEVLDQLVQ
jgi:hypothetical protein